MELLQILQADTLPKNLQYVTKNILKELYL